MRQYQKKIEVGRNSPCLCGSGLKYKKCCLNNDSLKNEGHAIIQTSINKLKKRNTAGATFVDSDKIGAVKMSEIILEYADELLELSPTRTDKENTIGLVIVAWNISLADEDKRAEMIDSFLVNVLNVEKNSCEWDETHEIFCMLIEKKLYEYPSLDRLILDFEFIQLGPSEYHLNVISTLENV